MIDGLKQITILIIVIGLCLSFLVSWTCDIAHDIIGKGFAGLICVDHLSQLVVTIIAVLSNLTQAVC